MKKVAIIGTVGIPANYGGFESLVEQFVQRLWDDFEFTVYCQRSAFAKRPARIGKVNLKYMPLHANGITSVLHDMLSILHALSYADTLLILGVGGCTLLPVLRFFGCRKRILVNIDGIEWRRPKWTKIAKWYLHFAERCAVKYSDSVIGDNQVIVDYVQRYYHRECNLIEYGADSKKLEV